MTKYIPKSTLVAEIERRMEERDNSRDEAMWNNEFWPETEYSYRSIEDEAIIDLINTLEVKEVDLESEMDKFYEIYRKNGITYDKSDNEVCFDWKNDELSEHEIRLAKHFFELGLKARQ